MSSADPPLWRTPRYAELPTTPTRRKLAPPPHSRADAAVRASGALEDYELGEVLGSGGFGHVRAARDVCTGVRVAVKIVDKRKMAEAGITDRIMNEVRLHSRLAHPAVVKLLHWFEDAASVYLVLERCATELQEHIRTRQYLEEDEAARLFTQLVQGLYYLHTQGIIHRDLKLSNLLLTVDGDLKIADFGLAVQLETGDAMRNTFCGTPNYIAPEIVARKSHGLTADLWSLGVMLFTFLTGSPPFETEEVDATLRKVALAEYAFPDGDGVSPAAKDLIEQLLQKEPTRRLGLLSVLHHPFVTRGVRTPRGSVEYQANGAAATAGAKDHDGDSPARESVAVTEPLSPEPPTAAAQLVGKPAVQRRVLAAEAEVVRSPPRDKHLDVAGWVAATAPPRRAALVPPPEQEDQEEEQRPEVPLQITAAAASSNGGSSVWLRLPTDASMVVIARDCRDPSFIARRFADDSSDCEPTAAADRAERIEPRFSAAGGAASIRSSSSAERAVALRSSRSSSARRRSVSQSQEWPPAGAGGSPSVADTTGVAPTTSPVPLRGGGHLTVDHAEQHRSSDANAAAPTAVAVFPPGVVLEICGTRISGSVAPAEPTVEYTLASLPYSLRRFYRYVTMVLHVMASASASASAADSADGHGNEDAPARAAEAESAPSGRRYNYRSDRAEATLVRTIPAVAANDNDVTAAAEPSYLLSVKFDDGRRLVWETDQPYLRLTLPATDTDGNRHVVLRMDDDCNPDQQQDQQCVGEDTAGVGSEPLAEGMLQHAMECLSEMTSAHANADTDLVKQEPEPEPEPQPELAAAEPVAPPVLVLPSDAGTQTAMPPVAAVSAAAVATQTASLQSVVEVAVVTADSATMTTPMATATAATATETDCLTDSSGGGGEWACKSLRLAEWMHSSAAGDSAAADTAAAAPYKRSVSGVIRASAWISSVGWCMRMRGGALVIATEDGALLSIDRAGRTVSLTDASGTIVCQKGMLEAARDPALRDRLQLVPRFTELLRKAPSA